MAFIDGQNLHLGALEDGWSVDLEKLRIYLRDKYKIEEAYYFLGYLDEDQQGLYRKLQRAGFIVVFKEHSSHQTGKKKGNVDTDIVFEMMKSVIEEIPERKILLISGDGDYKKTVDYLIKKNRFLKILFPNKKFASSLYRKLETIYYDNLKHAQHKIEYKKKKSP